MFLKFAVVLGLSAVVSVVEYYLYLQRRRISELEKLRSLEKVIFFDDSLEDCRGHLVTDVSCGKTCSVARISYMVDRINECQSTLDLCMFLMTSHNMSSTLAAAVKRGVRVRMLYDYDMAANTRDYGCQISWLRRNGVEVRSRPYTRHMHHKFAVLDKQLVVTGSANWTLQAFSGNWENVVVSADPRLVHQFSHIFHELWDAFSLTQPLPESAAVARRKDQ